MMKRLMVLALVAGLSVGCTKGPFARKAGTSKAGKTMAVDVNRVDR